MKTKDFSHINQLLTRQVQALEQVMEVIKVFEKSGIQRADLTEDDIKVATQQTTELIRFYSASEKMATSLVKKAKAEEKAKAEAKKAKAEEKAEAKKAAKAEEKAASSSVKDDADNDDDLSFLE